MAPSIKFFIAHCICSLCLAAFLSFVVKIDKRWALLSSFLFFISQPAVFFIWGPYHYYGLYALTWTAFLLLAIGAHKFIIFLRGQESLVRMLFWFGVVVFSAGVSLSSISEINLRRDPLTFWTYESKRHPTAEAMDHLATAYARLDHFDEARGYYEKTLKINAHDRQAYLGIGKDYQRLGKAKEAIETYAHLLNLYPDDEKVYVSVIEAYGKAIALDPAEKIYQEKREEALGDLEELSKRRQYKAVDYFNLAFLYEQVGGKDEAIRFYTKAVQMKPDYKQALFNLAKLYQDTSNFKEALAVYERLLHFDPKYTRAYLNMGEIINALGDVPKARRFYLKVIDLDPQNGGAYFNLGYLSESQGNLQEAINYYEKAIDADPKNTEAYYNLGNVYARMNQNPEAIALYLKTVGLNPRHVDAFVNLSILSFKSGNFTGAIHYLEQAKGLGYNPPKEYLKTLEPYRGKG